MAAGSAMAAGQLGAVPVAGASGTAAGRASARLAGPGRTAGPAQAAAFRPGVRGADPAHSGCDHGPDGRQAGLMRILLVGASGFIGRHLLRAPHAEGHSLVATSRAGQGSAWPEVEWRVLDTVSVATEAPTFRRRPAI